MAITRVRARLGGEWITLEYNQATGRYEGTITPSGTSFHQPGGYFPVAVEAVNENGDTAEIDGNTFPGLRLAVREAAAPTLRLVFPPNGFLTTQAPVFIFEATDEPGGSGVDPDSFSLEGAEVEEKPDGYRYTWTPPEPWENGPHTLIASVSDYDGNVSSVSGAWVVDTMPPSLEIKTPCQRHVVDDESVLVSGTASDTNGVEVAVNGVLAGGETFSANVPLDVGENYITVTARDPAGWETTKTLYMIRLITDRTPANESELAALQKRPVSQWTDAELEWFQTAKLWGAYTADAMNRVGITVEFLMRKLRKRGYAPDVIPRADWTRSDATTRVLEETYCKNVEAIRDAQGLKWLTDIPIPETLRSLNQNGANQLEKALVETDAVFPKYTAWTSGEISCGGF